MTRWLLAAAAASIFFGGTARADHPSFDPATVYKVPLGQSPHRGPEDAPITIVEWSDFACRYCNRVNGTLEQLDRLYPGKLRWVYRQFPLDPDNTLAAEAALAAGAQGRFWPMHDRLFAVHGMVDRAFVEMIGAELGLDMNRFRADLDAGTFRGEVQSDEEAAIALGVTGTPTFFINGRPVHGNAPLRDFTDIVDEELPRAAAARGPDRYAALVANGHASADAPPGTEPAPHVLNPLDIYAVGLGLPGHDVGPADALVTIVEWSDFECPYCAKNAPNVARVRQEYGDKVRVIYRHMPLVFHPHAQLAAEAGAEAAHQGKFSAFADYVFTHPGKLERPDLIDAGRAVGLDVALLAAALDDRRWRDAVVADAAAGSIAGVDGTPTMFINGSPVIGAVSYDRMKTVVDARLADAEQLVAHGVDKADVYGVVMGAAKDGERADPGRMPVAASAAALELGPVDRETAVVAACRGHDKERADKLAERLGGPHKAEAAEACAAYGVDLP
ncbi:MAG TPA: thioredoxin domain-containing protein [Kofleriaceae bacterium]|nr:thioredoxin domain-containing protein [Kofleriaceae bacterium]